jgi:hypothetical protein
MQSTLDVFSIAYYRFDSNMAPVTKRSNAADQQVVPTSRDREAPPPTRRGLVFSTG